MALCSVVIPVYRNEESLTALLAELTDLATSMRDELEVVFVVDGSPDASADVLRRLLPQASFRSQLLLHSRNYGAAAAVRTGLQAARGAYIGVMAADLQEPASLMTGFFAKLQAGHDVAVGMRTERDDPALTALNAKIFWSFFRRFIMPEIPEGGVDVFGLSARARDALVSLPERNSSLVAQLFWIGFTRTEVPYARRPRPFGTSAWTFKKKVQYLLDSVYNFTDLPIRFLLFIGLGAMALAFVGAATVLIGRLLGEIPVRGYTPTVLIIVFFGGLNSFGLGIIGQYVWRTFENTKQRPLSIVSDRLAFEATSSPPPS
ncbi:MAG: glycosyltransferase family 2 protein [Archangium sp.]|nr:glycosyltransferase family 2 protein [Archangium sp.]